MKTTKDLKDLKNLGNSLQERGNELKALSIYSALHWFFTKQPKVNLLKEAITQGNLRYFSGRAAVGLFFLGSLTHSTSRKINSVYAKLSDENDNNNSTGNQIW